MNKITAAITGVGAYLPDYILDNSEISRMVDTSDEWIMTRVGIKTRHILKGEGLGTSYMAERAVRDLLEKTNTDPMDVDMVICATVTPDMFFPSTSIIVADKVGMKNAFGYDLIAACSSFIYALVTGSQFIETGKYKKVVVIGADKMSSIIDPTDRNTLPLFGDGAAAVLLEPNEEGFGIKDSLLHADGEGGKFLYMKAGGSAYPASEETVKNRWHYAHQEGQQVFKAAVTHMADVAESIMVRNNLKADDVRYLVPHQANLRIIDATAHRMGLSSEKCMINIQKFGNTTSGTIPLCLWDYESRLAKGDNLVLAAFGGGFTWGSIYLKWAYDGGNFSK
jgi:3-oxoacyl-[acyl-carrier-protein] synthase-3